MPAVSVITPAWNAAPFVADTIDSVRAQTFADWEMLIVDDGSTDDTAAIVGSYAAADRRIRLLQQQNAGPSTARNRAMAAARGELFTFLDSDDRWSPHFLATQLQIFEQYPDTALVTGTGFYDGGPLHGQPTRPFSGGVRVLPPVEIIANESAVFIMTVFRRTVYERIGGMDETQWTSEDYDFWLRAALAGFIFRESPRPLALYRVRAESLSRNRVRMLQGILHTFSKTRPLCSPGSDVLRALDAQVGRFEGELLLEQAKTAIEQGNFREAAERLRALRARGGDRLIGITAWLATYMPPAAALAYRMRDWRPSRFRLARQRRLRSMPAGRMAT